MNDSGCFIPGPGGETMSGLRLSASSRVLTGCPGYSGMADGGGHAVCGFLSAVT